MAGNEQVKKILDSISKKSKEAQDELVVTIIDDFEDAVKSMNDPLKRAKLSLDKARETLDASKGNMELFETRFNETLTKFEESFVQMKNDIVNDTNRSLAELKNEFEDGMENTRKLIENNSTLETKIAEVSSKLDEISEENKVAIKDSLDEINSSILKASEILETHKAERSNENGNLLDKLSSVAVNIEQNNEEIMQLRKETEQYKDLLVDFQMKYEQSNLEAAEFKNKARGFIYVIVALGVLNFGLIIAVLTFLR